MASCVMKKMLARKNPEPLKLTTCGNTEEVGASGTKPENVIILIEISLPCNFKLLALKLPSEKKINEKLKSQYLGVFHGTIRRI